MGAEGGREERGKAGGLVVGKEARQMGVRGGERGGGGGKPGLGEGEVAVVRDRERLPRKQA